MAEERTFIMIKPDGVERGLVEEIIARFERAGLRLIQIRRLTIDENLAAEHYAEHSEKPFYSDLVSFITSGPVVAMEWSGEAAVETARAIMGATDPKDAAPGTIRGDFGEEVTQNLVHGSDSVASAERELALFFAE